MKVKSISLSWFRGVASKLTLAAEGQSVVVYGPNGSGKSTFPDAFEYLINGGKIGHLSHEYSGSRLELAVRNTHTPAEEPAVIDLSLQTGEHLRVEISATGKSVYSGSSKEVLEVLNAVGLERLILRQDEVSHFIHATKGEKYSALLPLLGLEGLEQVARNLNALRLTVSKRGEVKERRQRVDELDDQAREVWPELSEERVVESVQSLALRHGLGDGTGVELVSALEAAISLRTGVLESERRRFDVSTAITGSGIEAAFENLVNAESVFRSETGRLLDQKVGVLEATEQYARQVTDRQTDCPACGRPIDTEALSGHVRDSLVQLERAQDARNNAARARRAFSAGLSSILHNSAALTESAGVSNAMTALGTIEPYAVETGLDPGILESLRAPLSELLSNARDLMANRPPSAAELVEDSRILRGARGFFEAKQLRQELSRLEGLETTLAECEIAIRELTKRKTRAVVDGLSIDIGRLWEKLHPGEKVENIHLHIPGDADKAIDIALKFHGVDQPSPRLALSEGHRNSLGLCIFFALALATDKDTPIILDDIVSSLDREHRGMLVDLFLEDFASRQVLLFTHDREWFSELRGRLPEKSWQFRRLRSWSDPARGSEWVGASGTFDDARALLEVKPEAAGNEVRKIMDVELAKVASKLHVEMVFLLGDRNDHRTAHEFLEKIVSLAGKSFRRRKGSGSEWEPFAEAATMWVDFQKLLVSWGNRASHGGTLTRAEAERLISVAEQALGLFKCSECNDWVWVSEQASRDRVQCSCGNLRWKHG